MKNKINTFINELQKLDINDLNQLQTNLKLLQIELDSINHRFLKNKEKIEKEEQELLKIKTNYIPPIYDYNERIVFDENDSDLESCNSGFSDNLFGMCNISDNETFTKFKDMLTSNKFTYYYINGSFTNPGIYYIFLEESFDRCGDHCYNYKIIQSIELEQNQVFKEIFLKQKDAFNKQHNKEIL
jgi:hypothetical protein